MVYSIYAAPWGQPKSAIDFTNPVQTTSDTPIILHGIRGNQTTGSRYLCIRQTANGIEEKNFNTIRFTLDGNGDWTGNYPSAPYHLSATVVEGNRVELRWEYLAGTIVPDGFNVYSGTGSVDYSTAIATVAFQPGIQTTVLPAISADTTYGVRAFHGLNEEANTSTVVATAPPTLVAPTVAAISTTWRGE